MTQRNMFNVMLIERNVQIVIGYVLEKSEKCLKTRRDEHKDNVNKDDEEKLEDCRMILKTQVT